MAAVDLLWAFLARHAEWDYTNLSIYLSLRLKGND